MCSWTNPSIGKFKTQRDVPVNETAEEDDESEDQVVYRYDLPNELLGLYQQRHQVKYQGTSHGIITKEKKRLPESSTKVLVPQSAVEEAAWASLTQADKLGRISSQHLQDQEQNEISHGHLDSTKGVQEGQHGDAPRKISWAQALEHLINEEVQGDEKRAPLNLRAAQPGEARAEVDLAQTTVKAVKDGGRTAGESSKSHTEPLFETSSHSKGKLKHHTTERFRINSKAPQACLQEGAPVPLAQRLQELVREDTSHNSGPPQVGKTASTSSSLTIAEKLQFLIESSATPEGYHKQLAGTKVNKQSPSRARKSVYTVQINRSTIQDDIVDCPNPDEGDSGVQGRSRYLENPVQRSRSARNVEKYHALYKDEPLEDIDNDDDDFFDKETRLAKVISRSPSIAPTSISERFRNALLSASPDATSTDSCYLSARLESLLSAQKSKQMHFTMSLQRKQQEDNLGRCLEVVIMGTSDEAQLTTCQCEVLRSPEEWNHERSKSVSTETAQNASVIEVIYSKISSGVELHVGRVVRIHPPWQEVPRGRQKGRLIFCTFFCEVMR